jgi:AraC-like DNA-binding protein
MTLIADDILVRDIQFSRHDGEAGSWELARARPHASLEPDVIDYTGYRESGGQPLARREVAASFVPLIINFGPAFQISEEEGPGSNHASFMAGIYARPVIVGSRGTAYCLQVNFTPLGALRFFRFSQSEIEGRTVSLDDVMGAQGKRLVEELHDAPGWRERFRLLDGFIARRFDLARGANADVREVWRALCRHRGNVSIVELASKSGVSRRHLAKLFREEIGVTPKTMARILRFENARDLARNVPRVGWADLAYATGYADQAHLAREFKGLSGLTPEVLLRRDRAETGLVEPLAG